MQEIISAQGQGELLIGDHADPVTYELQLRPASNAEPLNFVEASVHLPRDWLIQRNFTNKAMLVLASGDQIAVWHGGPLDVSSAISVVLKTQDLSYSSREVLLATFPEFSAGV